MHIHEDTGMHYVILKIHQTSFLTESSTLKEQSVLCQTPQKKINQC